MILYLFSLEVPSKKPRLGICSWRVSIGKKAMRKRNLAVNCPSSADKMTVLIILMKYLFILPALLLLASAAPEADLVDLLIPGYVNHKFYSGPSSTIQASLISTPRPSTTSSLTPKLTPTMTPLSSGWMEDPAAPACSVWPTKMGHLCSSRVLSISKSIHTPGIWRPIYCTSLHPRV